jgi:hypothetical protein
LAGRFQYQARAEPVLPEALRPPESLVHEWFVQPSEPVRVKRPINVGPSLAYTERDLPGTGQRGWYQQASEPVRVRKPLPIAARQSWVSQPKLPPDQTITVADWWQQPSEPVRARQPLNAGPSFAYIRPSEAAELGSWASQQVQPSSRTLFLYQSQTAPVLPAELAPPVTGLRWWRQASEPVRVKPRLLTARQQAWAANPKLLPDETIDPDKWWQPASEPVRVRPRLATAAQQAWAAAARLIPDEEINPDKWWQPASEPVRRRPRSEAALIASGGVFVEISIPERATGASAMMIGF